MSEKQLWSDTDKGMELLSDIDPESLDDACSMIYNLHEDLLVIKEDNTKLKAERDALLARVARLELACDDVVTSINAKKKATDYEIAIADTLHFALNETPQNSLHTDDVAAINFSNAMREKLRLKREQGYSGWDDEAQCRVELLAKLLVDHIPKGDVVDIANFCMMLNQRGANPEILQSSLNEIKAQAVRSVLMECDFLEFGEMPAITEESIVKYAQKLRSGE